LGGVGAEHDTGGAEAVEGARRVAGLGGFDFLNGLDEVGIFGEEGNEAADVIGEDTLLQFGMGEEGIEAHGMGGHFVEGTSGEVGMTAEELVELGNFRRGAEG